MCLCEDVPAIDTRTRVVIIQHADEAWNRIGTARLVHLGLKNSVLLEGERFDESPELKATLESPGRERVLLFPSRDATALELRPADAPPLDLVVIDGTWSQAKGVVNKTAALRALPRVKLPPGERSRYRIRLQPRPECVSTVEAAVRALGVLEGGVEPFLPLLDAFDRMIDRQIQAALAAGRSPVRNVAAERARRPLPPAIAGDLGNVVLCFGETLGKRWREGEERQIDLVHWLALRPTTRELLSVVANPGRTIEDHEARYLELTPGEVAAGVSADELRARWSAFVRPGDVYVSWGYFATNALARILGSELEPQLDLRTTTKLVLNKRVQHPEDAAAELGLAAEPSAAGRGGKRLAALEAILGALRAGRQAPPVVPDLNGISP